MGFYGGALKKILIGLFTFLMALFEIEIVYFKINCKNRLLLFSPYCNSQTHETIVCQLVNMKSFKIESFLVMQKAFSSQLCQKI